MSGVMVAVAGNAQNVIYAAGLYKVETSTVQQSPVTDSTSTSDSQTIERNWIGYFLSPSTGSVNLGVQATAFQGDSAQTTGRLWLGSTAAAGNNAQADVTITRFFGSGTSSANFNLTQGVYYPVRIRWNGIYQGDPFNNDAGGSITFQLGGSSNVSGRIFYNSLSNGF
jgi:hypothetical protein